jgi:hypothetical protein
MLEMPKLAIEGIIAVASAALGVLTRYARAVTESQGVIAGGCTINWRAVMIEVPGVLCCGLLGWAFCYASDINHPVIIAAVCSVCGHVGMAVLVGLLLRFVEPRLPGSRNKQD